MMPTLSDLKTKTKGKKVAWPQIKKAFLFAQDAHKNQKRLTGEAYLNHPYAVACAMLDWGLDTESVVAALLHDTIEDCGVAKEEIQREFGPQVAEIIDGVTKITGIRLVGSKNTLFVENLRKMILAMSKDLRVVLVKLADRLHNLQTLYILSPARRLENAIETLEIYAPLAERLGMGQVKGELEDLAFPYVYPEEYRRIKHISKSYYEKAEAEIEEMKDTINKALGSEGIKAEIHGRKKRLYSLWKKLQRPEIANDYSKVHDVVALRVLVKGVADCYTSLGVLHSLYRPEPHLGISDFIAQPKPNGYQSIHTKVFGPTTIVEVQIRSFAMHEEAEKGISAHWFYNLQKQSGVKDVYLEKRGTFVPKKLAWVKELTKWQEELTNGEEFLKAVKFDAFSHRNFIFSPLGDVYDLPAKATPVDFAFAVHTNLGRYIKGAKVNGKIVALDCQLKSGDVVEIIKAKNPIKIPIKWLNFAVTTNARREIRRLE